MPTRSSPCGLGRSGPTRCSTGYPAPNARSSGSNLPFTPDDVLVRGQLAQTHRAARVELLCGDADLGTEPELLAVGESRARVHLDSRGVDLFGELPCLADLAAVHMQLVAVLSG